MDQAAFEDDGNNVGDDDSEIDSEIARRRGPTIATVEDDGDNVCDDNGEMDSEIELFLLQCASFATFEDNRDNVEALPCLRRLRRLKL